MQLGEDSEIGGSDAFWKSVIFIVSAVLCIAVGFLILGPRPAIGADEASTLDVTGLPHVNAALNAITTILLIGGVWAVKSGARKLHQRLMISAFATSTAFLTSYVIYHWFKSGPRHYHGEHTTLYFVVLVSHILLAAGILPMVLLTVYRAFRRQHARHRRLGRWTFPVWQYVSLTGVQIYLMLYY